MNPHNKAVEKYAQAIVDVGAKVDTHRDGDASIMTFTFNEAQLDAFVSRILTEERKRWYIGKEINVSGGEYVVVGLSTMTYDKECEGEPEWKITNEIQEVAIAKKLDFSPSYQKPLWNKVSELLTSLTQQDHA